MRRSPSRLGPDDASHGLSCKPPTPNPPPRPQPDRPGQPSHPVDDQPRYQTEFDLPPSVIVPVLPPPKLLPPQIDNDHRVRSTQQIVVSDGITLHSLLYKPQIEGTHFFTYEITTSSIIQLIAREPENINLAAINSFYGRHCIEICLAALVEWSKLRKLLVRELQKMWEAASDPILGRLSLYLWRLNSEINIIQVNLRKFTSKLAFGQRVYFRYVWRQLDYWWMDRQGVETDFELLRLYDPWFFDALGRELGIMADELQATNDGDELASPNLVSED